MLISLGKDIPYFGFNPSVSMDYSGRAVAARQLPPSGSFNPSVSMDYSGRPAKGINGAAVDVSILLYQWITLEDSERTPI